MDDVRAATANRPVYIVWLAWRAYRLGRAVERVRWRRGWLVDR